MFFKGSSIDSDESQHVFTSFWCKKISFIFSPTHLPSLAVQKKEQDTIHNMPDESLSNELLLLIILTELRGVHFTTIFQI